MPGSSWFCSSLSALSLLVLLFLLVFRRLRWPILTCAWLRSTTNVGCGGGVGGWCVDSSGGDGSSAGSMGIAQGLRSPPRLSHVSSAGLAGDQFLSHASSAGLAGSESCFCKYCQWSHASSRSTLLRSASSALVLSVAALYSLASKDESGELGAVFEPCSENMAS